MRIEAIAIGTELLTTSRVDTNSIWIAQELASMGLGFQRKTAVGDDREAMKALFLEALHRSDLVICTGGLGPTFDDFTKETWAEVLGVELREDQRALKEMLDLFASRGRTPSPSNFKQALMPIGAEMLSNPVGSAPGVWWENPPGFPGRRIVLMPGVPREMKHMWKEQVTPRLAPLTGETVHTLRMVVAGVPESVLGERTKALREKHGQLEWTILASIAQAEFDARGSDPAALERARMDFAAELGADLVRVGAGDLEDAVLDALAARNETLALAESMTGGLLSARLTAIPGASRVLKGAAIAYSPEAKAVFADLHPAFISAHGTVSREVTEALATGIRAKLGSTWAIAITGNAGPDEDEHGPAPVGTAFIAIAGPDGVHCEKPNLIVSDRVDIQLRAAALALDLLRRKLL